MDANEKEAAFIWDQLADAAILREEQMLTMLRTCTVGDMIEAISEYADIEEVFNAWKSNSPQELYQVINKAMEEYVYQEVLGD